MTRVLIRSNQPAGKGGDERREQTRDDEDKGQVARGKATRTGREQTEFTGGAGQELAILQ